MEEFIENIEDSDENVEVRRCNYSQIMKLNGISGYCGHIASPNSDFCNHHVICKCGLPTDKNYNNLCCVCKCSCENCSSEKIKGKKFCKTHSCEKCENFKQSHNVLCYICRCSIYNCKNIKSDKEDFCYQHLCDHCNSHMAKSNSKMIEISGYGSPCPNAICKCIIPNCNKDLANKFTCYYHQCKICKDLYNNASQKDIKREIHGFNHEVHVITNSSHKIHKNYDIHCPNQKVIECHSEKNGYLKSELCIGYSSEFYSNKMEGLYNVKNICQSCATQNRCNVCYRELIGQNKENKLHGVCDNCLYIFDCLNCNKKCSRRANNKLMPDLCSTCYNIVFACLSCKKVFINSDEFDTCHNLCAKCILTSNKYYMNKTLAFCAIAIWKNDDIDNYILKISKINKECKISKNTLFNLVLHLLDKITTPDSYKATLKLLLNKCNDDDVISEYLSKDNSSNLVGLFIRCSKLPNELISNILSKI